jgi:hypothetical protein
MFDSWRYQIFLEVVGLEWGPLSLVSTNEELLGRKISGYSLEKREYGRRGLSLWSRGTFYPQKLVLTLPTSGDFDFDRRCGLVSEFLATDPEVPGSIPGATRFSEQYWVSNVVHSAHEYNWRATWKK